MRKLRERLSRLRTTEGGSILVESLVAIVALSFLATSVIGGLSTTHISGFTTQRQSIAENIARRQMAAISVEAFVSPPHTYTSVATPPGYTVTAEATEEIVGDTTTSRITVTVFYDGVEVLVLEGNKSKL